MKVHTILSLMTATLLCITPLSYATEQESAKPSAAEVRQKLTDAAETIKNYSADKRDEAAKKAKAALDALDARIDTLEGEIDKNWEKMDKLAREQARGTLSALRKQRLKVAEWYGGLKGSSAGAWEDMKKGFSDAYQSLQHAWEKAEREHDTEQNKEAVPGK
jgi:hypothetical protein